MPNTPIEDLWDHDLSDAVSDTYTRLRDVLLADTIVTPDVEVEPNAS